MWKEMDAVRRKTLKKKVPGGDLYVVPSAREGGSRLIKRDSLAKVWARVPGETPNRTGPR